MSVVVIVVGAVTSTSSITVYVGHAHMSTWYHDECAMDVEFEYEISLTTKPLSTSTSEWLSYSRPLL
jgi:hypothetical protein